MARTVAMFYNVDLSVGKGGANSPTDVMLVQYMLWHICIQPRPNWEGQSLSVFPDNPPNTGPEALFPHNGVYTKKLDDWIAMFQRDCSEMGHPYGPLTVDGRINRAPIDWGRPSSGRRTWYTIQAMNLAMITMNNQSFLRLPNLSDVPAPLSSSLTRLIVHF